MHALRYKCRNFQLCVNSGWINLTFEQCSLLPCGLVALKAQLCFISRIGDGANGAYCKRKLTVIERKKIKRVDRSLSRARNCIYSAFREKRMCRWFYNSIKYLSIQSAGIVYDHRSTHSFICIIHKYLYYTLSRSCWHVMHKSIIISKNFHTNKEKV